MEDKNRALLEECLEFLVELDCKLEEQCGEWYEKSQTIAELNDFYKSIENDDGLNQIIGRVVGENN